VVLNPGGWVTPDMLPPGLVDGPPAMIDAQRSLQRVPDLPSTDTLVGLTLAEAERRLIEATMARHGGSIPKAARVLDVSPSTLYRKIESWKAEAG
jgi:DNA-binding NtrC family response regulator